jgi:hypothetical protein
MPQANVTLLNLGTAERRVSQTDGSGNYQFVNLVPGQHRVEVEHSGFRRFVREPITVEVQSAVRIDVAMQVGDVTQTVEVSERLNPWFDTSAFTATSSFAFGNLARSLTRVRSHGIANYDFTVFKNTPITERFSLQFRTEIFNAFNRVQFSYPGTAMGNPQFGVVSGQYNNPRLIQFALRLLF